MPRRAEPLPGTYARAVTAELRRLQAARGISIAEIARSTPLSANYLAERLRDEKSFTLTDIEVLGDYLGFAPAAFLAAIRVPGAVRILAPAPGVGATPHTAHDREDLAAGMDHTQAATERESP